MRILALNDAEYEKVLEESTTAKERSKYLTSAVLWVDTEHVMAMCRVEDINRIKEDMSINETIELYLGQVPHNENYLFPQGKKWQYPYNCVKIAKKALKLLEDVKDPLIEIPNGGEPMPCIVKGDNLCFIIAPHIPDAY